MSDGVRARAPRPAEMLVVGGLALVTTGLWYEDYRAVDPATVAALLLRLGTVLPLMWLRSRPWPVLAAVAAAQVGSGLAEAGDDISQGPLYVAAAVYGVACYRPAPRSLLAAVVGAGAILVSLLPSLPGTDGFRSGLVRTAVLTAVASAVVGVAWLLGSGRRRIATDAERLRRLTAELRAEQEISERRAARAERARIAADLHDIVAHHVSAIAVQAHATADLLGGDASARRDHHAGDRVATIAAAADAALVEMRRMLRLLVDPADRPAVPGEPSLAHLDKLAEVAESAGCRIATHVEPRVAATPHSLQICAYRIVQEALTNVVKHAGGTDVNVYLRRDAHHLIVSVDNGPPAPSHRPVSGSGMGLLGMRERIAVFGGTLRAGQGDDGRWMVTATLPTGAADGSHIR